MQSSLNNCLCFPVTYHGHIWNSFLKWGIVTWLHVPIHYLSHISTVFPVSDLRLNHAMMTTGSFNMVQFLLYFDSICHNARLFPVLHASIQLSCTWILYDKFASSENTTSSIKFIFIRLRCAFLFTPSCWALPHEATVCRCNTRCKVSSVVCYVLQNTCS